MGIKSLIAGTIHPAAYVFLGNAINIKNTFESFHFDSAINTRPIDVYNNTIQYFTTKNADLVLKNIGEQFMHIDLGNIKSSITSSFFDHGLEWQSAAAWGATSTIVNMVLKKFPGIKHHEYLRLSLATVIGAGMTIAGYQYALGEDLPLNHFLEIAYKVALIGIPLQVLNRASQGGLNFTYASAEKIASLVKGSCAFGLATLKFFAWEGPEKIRPTERQRVNPHQEEDSPQEPPSAPAKGRGRVSGTIRRAATMPAPSTQPPPRSASPSPEPQTEKDESSDSD